MAKKLNYLDFSHREQLYNWMRAHSAELKDMDRHQAAAKATEQLGFQVTFANIDGLKKQVGVTLKRKSIAKRNGHKRSSKRDVEMHSIRCAIIAVAKAQVQIMGDLGVEIPEPLKIVSQFPDEKLHLDP